MKKLLALILASALFLMCGCSASTSSDSADQPGQETKEELILAVGFADHGQFDPKKGWGTAGQIRLTHSSLLSIASDLSYANDLATSYEVSEDGLTWTFPLREDVKFSNGEPVTAEDVKFTYEMLKEDGIKFDLTFVDNIKVLDEYAIEFDLSEPRSTFVSQLVEIGIVPKDRSRFT